MASARTALVIDASVAIKWVVGEAGAEDATALQSFRCVAPDLLVPECTNILWKKVRRSELSLDEARYAARLLAQAGIDLLPMRRLMEHALTLAVALDHPAYDCLYMSLAASLDCPFVTADKTLCNKVRAHDPAARILELDRAATVLGPARLH